MRGFDVLDPHLNLYNHAFLEASAGTGKTFAIEQVVAKMLLDPFGPEVDQILLVTFTKAAVSDLKKRIRKTIEGFFAFLNGSESPPEYFSQFIQYQKIDRTAAKRKLFRSLSHFEDMHIFTIHGFCFYHLKELALESGFPLDRKEETTSEQFWKEAINDFFRTEMSSALASPEQMHILFQHSRYDFSLLQKRFVELLSKRIPLEGGISWTSCQEQIQAQIEYLHHHFSFQKEKLFEDLKSLGKGFSGFCDRQKNIKIESINRLESLAEAIYEKKIPSLDPWLLSLLPEKRLKNATPADIHYPGLLEALQEGLLPLIQLALDPLAIEAQVVEKIRQWSENRLQKEELFFYDDLVFWMERKVQEDSFAEKVRASYRAVFIDEFQDTDQIQWKIFSTLFHGSSFNGTFYVVGDPKQSIYRFRKADLYTYLEAKKSFPASHCYALQHNYRSIPSLVNGLNQLLAGIPDLFELPRWNEAFSCPQVEVGLKEESFIWKDGKKAVHLHFAKNENEFFRLIGQEIIALIEDYHFSLSSFAILVKDRYQADRLKQYFQGCHIPASIRKNRSLLDSKAFSLLFNAVRALLHPIDKHLLKIVLGGPLFCWREDQLTQLPSSIIEKFCSLHTLLEKEGLLVCMKTLLEQENCLESLFKMEDGEEVYKELKQLLEVLAQESLAMNELESFLLHLQAESRSIEKYTLRDTAKDESVTIMTIHASKGLEFDIVFPIGLILAAAGGREFIPDEIHRKLILPHENTLHYVEMDAEKMRQLYVAVTRAKKRLYFPILMTEKKKEMLPGFASPLALFLEKRLGGQQITEYFRNSEYVSFEEKSEILEQRSFTHAQHEKPILEQPLPLNLHFPSICVHSYSSLIPPSQGEKEYISSQGLPSGPETGRLMHLLFEKMPFEQAFKWHCPQDFLSYSHAYLHSTPLEDHEEAVAKLLFHALHTPLPAKKGSFPLNAVDPTKIWKEMEFLIPSKSPQGYLKGFVDLFFEYQGVYYFLDWKSNDLGPEPAHYCQEALLKEMEYHHYFLQEKIYRQALEKYLALFDSKPLLGESFYIFLRGLPEGIVII